MRTHTATFKDKIKEYGREFSQSSLTTDTPITHLSGDSSTFLRKDEITNMKYYYDCDLLKTRMQTLVINSLVNIPVGTQIRYTIGLKVSDSNYEYMNYGYFYVNKVEEQKDKKEYIVTCYDKMINTMKDYADTGATFPTTLKNYLIAILDHLGLELKNPSATFTNYDKNVTEEHYIDSDGNSMGYTFRDVLDDIAEATGSFICISENGKVDIRTFTTTNDTINEDYFSDKSVSLKEHYGPINTIVLSRAEADNLYYPTTLPANPIEFKISDNPILEQTNREDFIQGIYNNLNGLEFYLNDFNSTGVLYYDLGDKYNVSIGGTSYPCLMLNDTVTQTTGIKEQIYTKEPKKSVTEYKYASSTDKLDIQSRNAYIIANKAEGTASMIVNNIGSNNVVNAASIIASINNDTSQVSIDADKINLNGAVTANNNFKIKNDGSVEINNGSIELTDTTSSGGNSKIKITGSYNGDISNMELYSDVMFMNTQYNGYIIVRNIGDEGLFLMKVADDNSYSTSNFLLHNQIIMSSNNTTTFEVDGSTGNTTIGGNATIGGTTTTTDLNVSGDATITRLTLDGVNMNNYSGKRVNGADANNLGTGVYYLGSSSTNTPTNYLATLSVNGGTNDRAQFGMSVGGIEAYFRVKPTASWTDWKRLVYIEESGSNTNGKYVKYNDGTLIQWNRLSVKDQAISNSYGSMYIGTRNITFPVAFVGDPPSVQCSCFTWGTSASWGCVLGNSVSLTGCSLCGFDIASRSTGTNVFISWYAIGKWK